MSEHSINRRVFIKSTADGSAVFGMSRPYLSLNAKEQDVRGSQLDSTRDYLDSNNRRGPFSVTRGKRPHIFLITADMNSAAYIDELDVSPLVYKKKMYGKHFNRRCFGKKD